MSSNISHSAPPSRQFTYSTGTVISSSAVTSNEDSIFNYLQSGVDEFSDGTIVNADINSSANIQSDKLNLTAIAQSVANSGSTALNGTTNSIGNGGSDTLTLNVPGGMTLSAATTWTLTGALTFSGTIADLGTVTTANIDGGTMDGVQIGGTTATGELIVNDASDDADGLGSQGTSGQYLQSAGAGANPTWVTPLGVLLSTTSFSAAGFTGDIAITAGKRYFGVLHADSVSAANINILLRFDDDTTATAYQWMNNRVAWSGTPSDSWTGDISDGQISIHQAGANSAEEGVTCNFWIDADTIEFTNVEDTISVHGVCDGGNDDGITYFHGQYRDGSTLTTLEFYASGGNFTGNVKLYELN